MDSVSHVVIGAAIGEVMLGRKIGRWGMLIGAFAKTFPDFDLLYTGLNAPRLYLCHHRGHTHSLVWETLYAIPLAYLFYWLAKGRVSFRRMLALWLTCLYGHSLLDWFTNYGTRLFLPFTNESFAINTISIVDVVFTLPMLLLGLTSIFFNNSKLLRYKLNKYLLFYCCIYLFAITCNKLYMNQLFAKSLQEEGIQHKKFMTNPVILNNVLWYGIAVNDSMLYTAEYSLLDKSKQLQWTAYARNMQLAELHPDREDIAHLTWFGKGYTICQQKGDTLNYYCVKFGKNNLKAKALEESFVFHYTLYKNNNSWQMGFKEPDINKEEFTKQLNELWQRILGIE